MKHNIELINGVAEYGSGFNELWHGTIKETDAALWRGLPVPTHIPGCREAMASCQSGGARKCNQLGYESGRTLEGLLEETPAQD